MVNYFLQNAEHALGNKAWLRIPTLFWLDTSDAALLSACYAGMVFSVLLLFGRLQLIASIMLFILYLSVFHAGQTFMSFQWDHLLLEAGFLTIFLTRGNNRFIIFLFHWLLFRLRFLSGLSKTTDPSWMNLSTLNYYFETQPLPHAGSWYFHQLPEWLLRTGTGFTLFVELIVPFFIFLPRHFRLLAAFSTIFLQLLIIASSNHNWINLLTIALCLFLLDDKFMSSVAPGAFSKAISQQHKEHQALLKKVSLFFGALILLTSLASTLQVFAQVKSPAAFAWVRAYGLGNVYHVFPTMQTERHELIIEGSHDGKFWQPYVFKYKPNNINDIPPFIVPHQPRLDWMIWFIPPKPPEMQLWFDGFIEGLRRNEPNITGLLKHNPFESQAPRYIRILSFRYHFTNIEERNKTGAYWKAEFLGEFPFVPPRRP